MWSQLLTSLAPAVCSFNLVSGLKINSKLMDLNVMT